MRGRGRGGRVIVSFAWTVPALLAGAKTMTRRDWTYSHARKFHVGMRVDAWDRLPRVAGAKRVAVIELTRDPWRGSSGDLTPEDYEREGFAYLAAHGDRATVERVMTSWGARPRELWVVEFKLVGVVRH
jgi:hypothetical protein